MEQEKDTQVIYFKDLLFAAMYRWKAAVVTAVVLALLLGGVALMSNGKNVTINGISITPEAQIKIDQLQSNVEQIQYTIDAQGEYLANSVYMQLDPFTACAAGFHIRVVPHSLANANGEIVMVDPTSAILRAYRSYLSSTENIAPLAEMFGMEPVYFIELITFDTSYAGCLGINIRATSVEQAQEYADAVLQLLTAQTPVISQMLEPHTISVIPFTSGPKLDVSLYDSQNAARNRLTSMKTSLTNTQAELDRMLPTELISGDSNPVLFAVVGAVLGVFLVIGVACVAHIGSAKVYSARVLTNHTGIRVLGCLKGTQKHDPVTRWLRKLEGRCCVDNAEAIAANLRNRCQDGKSLLIMGNFAPQALEQLTQALSPICCTVCTDPQNDPQALKALPHCDGVVLAETCHQTRYDAVTWAMETVADHQKPLLGCILIDG